MSKRGQDTSNDGSPTAKARPVGLVMHYPGKEKFSPQSSGTLVNPENDDLNKQAQHASGRQPNPNNAGRSAKCQEIGCVRSRAQGHGILKSSVHEEDFSVFTESWEELKLIPYSQWNHTDECIDVENVRVADEGSHPSQAGFPEEFGNLLEHKIREDCSKNIQKKF